MAPMKNYTPRQMGDAMEAVRGGLSIAAAAKKFGVPITTLRNKVTGKSPAICSMGPPTILSAEEENILKAWIFGCAERHYPINKDKLLDSVQKIIVNTKRPNPFTNNRPGKKWYNAFLRRHPDIAERVSQNLTSSRDNVTETQIRNWFEEISVYLQSKGLLEVLKDPTRVYNTDESAFFLNPKPGMVLAKKGDKNVYSASGNEKENLTVLVTANAAGNLAPPMIVLPYERVPGYIGNSIPNSFGMGRSDTGWMCSETFYEYVTNVFYPWLVRNKITFPVIFFLDGHRSHLTSPLSEFCSDVGIEVIALFPNSTHILQPMDIAVFRPLKLFWKQETDKWKAEKKQEIDEWKAKNNDKDEKETVIQVKKENFAPIFQAAVARITKDCIKNGFKAGGLCPFGPEFIDFSKLSVNNRTRLEITQQASSDQNIHFLKMLEGEITKVFTSKKLALFKKRFYMHRSDLENEPLNEDLSLYIIWAKYNSLCLSHPSTTHTDNKIDCQTKQQIHESSVNIKVIDISAPSTSGLSHSLNNSYQRTPNKTTLQDENLISRKSTPNKVKCTTDTTLPDENLISRKRTPNKVQYSTATTLLDENIFVPSPFKKALFWPEPPKKKGKIHKEKIPSVITGEAWKEYNAKKELKKKMLEEEKEKRKLVRIQKKKQKEEAKKIKMESKGKMGKKGKNTKDNKNYNTKKRKISVSSDDETDSNITYAESDDDETFVDSDELDFWTNQCKNENFVHEVGPEELTEIDETFDQKMETQQKKNKKKIVPQFFPQPDIDKENIPKLDIHITIQDVIPTNKITESKEQRVEVQSTKNELVETKKNKVSILNDSSVNIILDEKTGSLRLDPKIVDSAESTLDDKSNVDSTEIEKQFVLATFKSQNGKKTYQYVCRIEEKYPNDKMVVKGLKSKKNKKTFRLVHEDISIIDEKDIISILPQPIFKDDYFIFPNTLEVKEM